MGRIEQSSSTQGRVTELKVSNPRKTGACTDGSFFIKNSLLAIDKSYNPKTVCIDNGDPKTGHYVCLFTYEGKLYIADYGNPDRKWTSGPFDSLDEYKKWLNEESPHWHGKVRNVSVVW